MIKRVLWDILCLVLVFFAPWWATLIVGVVGVVLFPWYVEIVFFGALYDALYGGVAGLAWYRHLLHMGIFALPLLVGEFVKTQINWRARAH